MITLLSRIFIKDSKNYASPQVRTAYGMLCSALGIILNIILFIGKALAGFLCGSIAIIADAVNNLSDAGSSIIALIGFKIASTKPDKDHPYGHGRMEYISGMIVAILILFMAYELIRSSVDKIIHPVEIETSIITILILVASIITKLYMFLYQRSTSKKINSPTLKATATDSISDTISTSVVLLSTLVSYLFHLQIDGYCGIAVGLFIAFSGIKALKETTSPLMGQAPDPELVSQIRSLVLKNEHILGIHDMMVHDYGPNRIMVSLHAEVSSEEDFLMIHDIIDNIERQIRNDFGCFATIHMDPIQDTDEETTALKTQTFKIITEINPELTLHDFRVVKGPSHTNLIFDVVKPFSYKISNKELCELIENKITLFNNSYYCVIEIDDEYCAKN